MKKISTLALTAVIACSMALPAFAEDGAASAGNAAARTNGTTNGANMTRTNGVVNDGNAYNRMYDDGFTGNRMNRANVNNGRTYGPNNVTRATAATTAATNNDGFNWGWLGLVGLIGLAGLRSRDRSPDRS